MVIIVRSVEPVDSVATPGNSLATPGSSVATPSNSVTTPGNSVAMPSIILIGDSHLESCKNAAVLESKSLNFGYSNVKSSWLVKIDQINNLELEYKQKVKSDGEPDVVVVMTGTYDLMITNDHSITVNKIKAFIHHLNSSPIKFIIVCSILERCSFNTNDETKVNKKVRDANKMLAKIFKDMKKVIFINVRPPGKVKDIIADDKYHLKNEGYLHIYKRISVTLEERVISQLPNISQNPSSSTGPSTSEVKNPEQEISTVTFGKTALTMDKRLGEFKDVLMRDYKRICKEEKDLAEKYEVIKNKLDTISKEKSEVVSVYKRLFGIDLTEDNEEAKPK